MVKWASVAAFGLCVVAAGISFPASAQMAGTYTGTTADGRGISFTIGTDQFTESLAVIDFSEDYFDSCPATINSSINGTIKRNFGPGADIASGSDTSFTLSDMGAWASAALHFQGDRVSGEISNEVPILISTNPYPDRPKKALLCSGKRQHFSATLTK